MKHSTGIIRKSQYAVQNALSRSRVGREFICHNRTLVLISRNFGAIAQLGERLHGMQEVVGSNPIGSISLTFR